MVVRGRGRGQTGVDITERGGVGGVKKGRGVGGDQGLVLQ